MSDASLLEPGWREAFVATDGVRLHTIEAGDANNPLVILLHGFPEFWWSWRRQIMPLALARFHVLAPDMRGYNLSDKPSGLAAYHLDRLAADVVALADAHGAARFHLVGHDWGAVVAWWVAARYPQRLHRLVIIDGPHPDILLRQALRHPSQAFRSTYAAFFQLPGLPEAALSAFDYRPLKRASTAGTQPGAFRPGDLDHYRIAWRRPGALTAMLNYYRALRLPRMRPNQTRIAAQTLVLWAEKDRYLERHVAEASLDLCDDGRLMVIEDASHWVHLEQADRVNAEITGFLHEPRSAPGP